MSNEKTTSNPEKRKLEEGSAYNGEAQLAAGGELHQIAGGGHPALTTNQGVALSDNQNSLRAHPHGPTLLEDFILREKITHFDHERINTGSVSLKLYSLYAPPNHRDGVVHPTRADAEKDNEHFDGKTTE